MTLSDDNTAYYWDALGRSTCANRIPNDRQQHNIWLYRHLTTAYELF